MTAPDRKVITAHHCWRTPTGQSFEAHVLALRPGATPFDLLLVAVEWSGRAPSVRSAPRRSRLAVIHAVRAGADALVGLREGDPVNVRGDDWGDTRLAEISRPDGTTIWIDPTPSGGISYAARTRYICRDARRRDTVFMAWGLSTRALAIRVAGFGAPYLDHSYRIEMAEVLLVRRGNGAGQITWSGRSFGGHLFQPPTEGASIA